MEKIFKQAFTVIEEAGKILREDYYKPKQIDAKSAFFDLVTESDKKIEKFLIERLARILPESDFLAEESHTERIVSSKPLWVIDPIDGTTNFVHQFPFVCISVGLQIEGKTCMGFVYNPIMQEFYTAIKGKGSFINKVPLQVSETALMNQAFLGTGFSYSFGKAAEDNLDYFKYMLGRVHGIRRPGSAALDLCMVARGVYDGYWEWYLHPWDACAGTLIVEEAGGKVSNFAGEKWNFADENIVVSNSMLHEEFLRLLSEVKANY